MNPSHRLILQADFFGALATVMVLVLAADPLAPHVGFPAWALRLAGALLIPFVVFVFRTARADAVQPRRVYGIVAFNVLWFLASIVLIASGLTTTLGAWLVAAQAALVVPLVLAECVMLNSR